MTIQDVNEAVTVSFTINPIDNVFIDENTPYTGPLPALSGDTPIGTVTYTLAGNDKDLFAIDPTTGQVSMEPRDYENPQDDNEDNVYELTLTATDEDANSASEDWTVTIQDVNEAVTVTFTIDPIADVAIDENTEYTGPEPTLSGDTPIGTVTYTLAGADASLFTIDPATGQVTMDPKDFELPEDANNDNVYELTLTATDEDANSASEDWTVTIQDVNEAVTVTFTIDPIADVAIDENTEYTGPEPTLSGDTPIGTVTYTLAGADASLFTIDPATGQVTMEPRDFENPQDDNEDNVYELTLTATDQDANSASEDWTVTIQDVNEAVTVTFTINQIDDVAIDENTPYTGPEPTLSGDTPIGDVAWTLGGADAEYFSINSLTGQVTMEPRDFELPEDANNDNVYEVTLIATDQDANSASEDWTVTIQDVNEAVTFTIDPIADIAIDENTPYTSVVPSITGTPIGTVTYTLTGNDKDLFAIDPTTGQVSMEPRDFEVPEDANNDNVYEVTLIATDQDANSANAAWTVTIQDVNEEVTFTINQIDDVAIDENTEYTWPEPTLSGDTPIGTVTYTLGGADADWFNLDLATGQVTMDPRDFELPEDANNDNVYEVSITATDEGNNSASEDWTVTIQDVNEAVTVTFIIDPIADVAIDENTEYTGPEPTLSGDTPIGTVAYTLGGNDKDLFTIDPATGQVTMDPRDFELPEDANNDNVYEVSITATDEGNNSASEDWTVTIERQVLSAGRNNEVNDLTLYPNPARDKVYIDIDPRSGQKLKQVNIYTMAGAYLYSENGVEIDTSRLSEGMYLFEIVTKAGNRSMKKVIIQ